MATAVANEAEKMDLDCGDIHSKGGQISQQSTEPEDALKADTNDDVDVYTKNVLERNSNTTPSSDISGNVMEPLVMEADCETSTASFDESTLEVKENSDEQKSPKKCEEPKVEPEKPPIEEVVHEHEVVKSPKKEKMEPEEVKEEKDVLNMDAMESRAESPFCGFEDDEIDETNKRSNDQISILTELLSKLETVGKNEMDVAGPAPKMSPKRSSDDVEPSSSGYAGSPPAKKIKMSSTEEHSPQSSIDYAPEESDLDDMDAKMDETLQAQEATEGEEESIEDMKEEFQTPKQLAKSTASATSTPAGKQRPVTDEIYRKPFNYGWKREFVYRAVPGISKDKGEVYYITPSGKKLRTKNDILVNLTPELTIENFTFAKAPIGVGSEYEIIRNAKPISRYVQPEINLGKRIPKPKGPKGASPPPVGWTATKAVKAPPTPTTPRQSTMKKQPPSTSQETQEPKPATSAPSSSSSSSAKSTGKTKKKKGEPCTIQCVDAMGIIPQLKCIKCLCLFHHECVAAAESGDDSNKALNNINHSILDQIAMGAMNGINTSNTGYVCESCIHDPLPSKTAPVATAPTLPTTSSSQPVTMKFATTTKAPISTSSVHKSTTSDLSKIPLPPANIKPSLYYQGPLKSLMDSKMLGNDVNNHNEHHEINDTNNNEDSKKLNDIKYTKNKKNESDGTQTIAVIKGRKYVMIRKRSNSTMQPQKEISSNLPIPLYNPLRPSMNSNVDGLSPSMKPSRMSTRSGSSKARRSTLNSTTTQDDRLEIGQRCTSGANFFGDVASGYNILLHTFQYLKVQELLRVSSVCRFWNMAANHRSLWKTVRMKNSQVNDWTGLAAALKRNETKHLDLRKMLISNTKGDEMWKSFAKNIQHVISLENIDLCRCSSKIVQDLFLSNPNLKMLNAVTIRDDSFSFENVTNLKNLEELRLRSIEGFNLEGDFSLKGDLIPLSTLTKLKHLSLTSFRGLCSQGVQPLANLTNLESLELGYCKDLNISFAEDVLPKLQKLERLRLEGGAEESCTLQIMGAISKLERLTQLELVNFDIKRGFDEKLVACKNLKRLLIIPTYVSQSATTNHIIITAALQMGNTLEVFTWAVTMELLRVTALYVDQCESPKKEARIDECIPILKPVPGQDSEEATTADAAVQQVEILPLPNVEKILHTHMPETKLKILKVPFHATWRQTIVIGCGKSSSSSNPSASTSSAKSKRDRSVYDA